MRFLFPWLESKAILDTKISQVLSHATVLAFKVPRFEVSMAERTLVQETRSEVRRCATEMGTFICLWDHGFFKK